MPNFDYCVDTVYIDILDEVSESIYNVKVRSHTQEECMAFIMLPCCSKLLNMVAAATTF